MGAKPEPHSLRALRSIEATQSRPTVVESPRQRECVLCRPGQERQRCTPCPGVEPGAVIRRERMPALSSGDLQVPLALVARRHRKALGLAEGPILYARHVVIAGQLKRR